MLSSRNNADPEHRETRVSERAASDSLQSGSGEHALAARRAWATFGRGRHPTKLNFGDCMAYGYATVERRPLLFKGGDFSLTDIEPALKD